MISAMCIASMFIGESSPNPFLIWYCYPMMLNRLPETYQIGDAFMLAKLITDRRFTST
jgi:hypothetical protein